MKKRIRDLVGSEDWLLENGNRVRLTGWVDYPYYNDCTAVVVHHEMGAKYYETSDRSHAGDIEVEVELA